MQIQQMSSRLSTRQISLLLTVIAFALWSYSITQAKLDIGFYGLISSLPVLFFASLVLLTIASIILWSSSGDNSKLLFLQLGLLIVALWLTPNITGGSQPFITTPYWLWGESEYIIRESHLSHPVLWTLWYHNWPGALLLSSTLGEVLGINNPDALIGLAPFLLQLVYLPLLYLLLRNTLGPNQKNHIWAGLWIFELFNWPAYTYLGPQSVAYIFLLFVLVVFTRSKVKTTSFGNRLGNIIVFGALTITHLLTNLVMVSVVFVLQIFRRVKASNLLIIGIVCLLAWTLYGAVTYFDARVPVFMGDAFRIDRLISGGTVEKVSGSESHQAVTIIRIVTTAICLGIAVLGYILSRRQKLSIFTDNTVLAIVAGSVLGILFIGGGYGFELIMRAIFFILPAIAYFSVKLLDKRVTALILCSLLIILLPMHFVSHYGNQAIDYLSPSHLSGLHFFEEHTTSGSIIGGEPLGYTKNTEAYVELNTFSLANREELVWNPAINAYTKQDLVRLRTPQYVCISEKDKAADDFWFDEPQFTLDIESHIQDSKTYNLVYVNADLKLYINQ